MKERLDVLLVKRNLAESREKEMCIRDRDKMGRISFSMKDVVEE